MTQLVAKPAVDETLLAALRELAGDELEKWLAKPNPAFGNRAPGELIKNGETDALWEAVRQIRELAYD